MSSSMYHCCVCGMPLRPGDSTVSRLAICWLKAKTKTVETISEELYQYRHNFCEPRNDDGITQLPLF